jgi:hypothetical protein
MPIGDLREAFASLDRLPSNIGFVAAVDAADAVVSHLGEWANKIAMVQVDEVNPPANKYVRALGALAQLWKAPELGSFPQHPSSLGQTLVLGGLGAVGGHYAGKLIDRVIPNDYIKAERAGTALGALLGVAPGLSGAYLNSLTGKPVWTSSFWDTAYPNGHAPTGKVGEFVDDSEDRKLADFIGLPPQALYPINVHDFQQRIWNDPRIGDYVPIHLRAAASGLVQGAANLPGRPKNSPFVTPYDIARMSIGMGSGLASGWLVGKTLGAIFGATRKTQDLLMNAGMAAGALKTVVPLAFGSDAYGY